MNDAVLRLCFRASFYFVFGILGTCCVTRAQSQRALSRTVESSTAAGPRMPMRKADWELTKDPVALLAVKRTGRSIGAAKEETIEVAKEEANGTADNEGKKAAEVALLEQRISEKQRRIALLMRLFVDDERPFLNDPGNTNVDETLQDRRKYEQDELLFETAELAKLQAKRDEMTAKRVKPVVGSR